MGLGGCWWGCYVDRLDRNPSFPGGEIRPATPELRSRGGDGGCDGPSNRSMSVLGLLYGLIVGALFAAVACGIERVFTRWQFPLRGIWFCSLLGTTVSTGALLWLANTGPQFAQAGWSSQVSIDDWILNPNTLLILAHRAVSPWVTSLIAWAWTVWSVVFAVWYASASLRVKRASKTWRRLSLNSREIYVSENLGPAVFGHLAPKVVIPQWFVEFPGRTVDVVLRHETQHILKRDPLLVLSAMCLVTLMPWNLFVVYQLQKLQFAIEVDCDARVVSHPGGPAAAEYSSAIETLLYREHESKNRMWMQTSITQLRRRIELLKRVTFNER
jgi:hypothetical protein